MSDRIGLGYDLHRLVPGRKLILGGLEIPFSQGLEGHSDADALIHAVIDALLGASGDGDIGRLFPDSDPAWKNARGADLLRTVVARLDAAGLEIVHVDTVIAAEKPAVAPHVGDMKKILCPLLGIGLDALGIKGKTNEGVGAIGRGEAIACWAVALLRAK